MEYKYNLAKLQYDKEKLEELIARQGRRAGQVFPKKLETQFWSMNLERAREHIRRYLWTGILIYFILTVLIIPGDYWIIDKAYFAHDFIRCIAGLVNGAFCLLALFVFANFKKMLPYFPFAAMALVFWAVISMSWLTMTVSTPALKHQAMMIICMIYILGFILSGVKPGHMLMTGLLAAIVTMLMLFSMYVKFDAMVMGRVLIGSCVLGFAISKMLCARERMIFLSILRADISEKIHRIHIIVG